MLLAMIGPWQLMVIAAILLPLFALINLLRNEFTGNNKIVWLLLILFLPIIGSILYFLMSGKQRLTSQPTVDNLNAGEIGKSESSSSVQSDLSSSQEWLQQNPGKTLNDYYAKNK